MRNISSSFAIFGAGLLAYGCSTVSASVPPPPPPMVEVLNPTYRQHTTDAECAGSSARISWRYSADGGSITSWRHKGEAVPQDELEKLNGWLAEFDGDFSIFLECNSELAIMLISEIRPVDSPKPRRIRVVWRNSALTLY